LVIPTFLYNFAVSIKNNEIMVRKTTTTKGECITFNVDIHYTVIGDNPKKLAEEVFNGIFKKMPYCVAYTKVFYDKGYKDGMLWGSPAMIPYDNGLVGYQNFNFFIDKEEAQNDYKFRSKLDDDYPDGRYSDVFLFENPNVDN